MTERFKKAYDSLVRAFFEGTLAKGTCAACACGNIICDAIGEPMTKSEVLNNFSNRGASCFSLWGTKRQYNFAQHKYLAKREFENEVNVAGYTTSEFAQIENAFEKNTVIIYHEYHVKEEQDILEDQYKGLCAVVDVLMKLDKEVESTQPYKQKFREHPKLAC